MKTETVEEFLKRGGKINDGIIKMNNDYSDKVFEKELHAFYNSKEWKKLKKEIHEELPKVCIVCGSKDELHVDHIKPVRYFWEERLNKKNLQLLCKDCNQEKGSILNWSLEWHIENKEVLSEGLTRRREELKKRVFLKVKNNDNIEAFRGLSTYETKQLNSCYSSYVNRCTYKKITPISKTKFRHFFESKTIKDVWSHTDSIKRYIKESIEKIQ